MKAIRAETTGACPIRRARDQAAIDCKCEDEDGTAD